MASSDILSRTLQSITSTKLSEISKQSAIFKESKKNVLDLSSSEGEAREKIQILLDNAQILSTNPDKLTHQAHFNVDRFNLQAKFDPSVSQDQLNKWIKGLRDELDVRSLRYEYATLYGSLVNEWLSDSGSPKAGSEASHREQVGRKEMHEQRSTWEKYVFSPLQTDEHAITVYLDSVFHSSSEGVQAHHAIKEATEGFMNKLERDTPFDLVSLKWCIDGLLASDLLTDEKRSILLDFSTNKIVLGELADVLNLRLSSLKSWSWGVAGAPIEQRRQLNGRYRFYQDEDLLDSIFFRYIGVKWSMHFKKSFTRFSQAEGVWKSLSSVTSEVKSRHEWFIRSRHLVNTNKKRSEFYFRDIFLEQLQDDEEEVGPAGYNHDIESESTTRKSPQQVTSDMLHLLVTDITIRKHIGKDTSVVRSDFCWFGPSLPHTTMFAVLRYFGVSEAWVDFFRRALEAPVQFTQDGPDAPVQIRKRGTAINGPLSDMLGETVLFCLDCAFNQETDGAILWRLHDDIWFWGDNDTCKKGWDVLTKFSKLTGLELAPEKTGSVHISHLKGGGGSSNPDDVETTSIQRETQTLTVSSEKQLPDLPAGDVRWSFLKLDSSTGRFCIERTDVDQHIAELRLQLSARKSVFDWVQAWNIYGSRFFTRNFGRPANCFGRDHVNEILSSFQHIQRELFADGSVTGHLKAMLSERFGVEDVPEGYLYFPISMGGLDLASPFVEPLLLHQDVCLEPDSIMKEFFTEEEAIYRKLKRAYEKRDHNSRAFAPIRSSRVPKPDDYENFMSFEEYTQYREDLSPLLAIKYEKLMKEPSKTEVNRTLAVRSVLEEDEWDKMSAYQKWIVALHGDEMIEKFGGLNVVDKGLLPTGMVSMLRQSRFKWES
jgi:hypothetical protein